MKISVLGVDRLTGPQREMWLRRQQSDPAMASPYFHPDFHALASEVRPGVEVAMIEESGVPVGFFPFERRKGRLGLPVAWPLNDFQAVIARPGLEFDAEELVKACGLSVWKFDHLASPHASFAPHVWNTSPSPFMDLSQGFDAYGKSREEAGCEEWGQAKKKTRKAANQVGPVRFEFHTDDDTVFRTLARWKGEQYVRTQKTNLFAVPWVEAFLESLRRRCGVEFAGVLSALYFGDRLAAVHLGMRCGDVLHAWFPAFETELARYSPGTILFFELAKAAAAAGIRRIDLGKGPEKFKVGLMSGSVPVAEGAVDFRPITRNLLRLRRSVSSLMRLPMLGVPVRMAARATRPLRTRMAGL
jgi:CelD/BcsL family acetyltransferase involved in cellulose biosynthesis